MCKDCGCDITNRIALDEEDRHYSYAGRNEHHKYHLDVHQGIISKNNAIAQQNRNIFQNKHLTVLNLLSSPGSGKTALIERMLNDCSSVGARELLSATWRQKTMPSAYAVQGHLRYR